LLNATPITTEPKDSLSKMAAEVSEPTGEAAPAGEDSGFQLQVASFKDQVDADTFVEQLQKRGHRAFRVAAQVPERGIWHRVRIGPFKNKYEAELYKKKFERSERVAPFVVDPDQVRRAEELREQKLRARVEKYGRP
jgi:cell division septation protein DedD